MRDNTLVQAQTQLDQIAAGDGERAVGPDHRRHRRDASGAQAGFDRRSVGRCSPATRSHLTYTDNATSTQHTLTLVRVDDPTALPLPNTATADPNDEVIGIDFSGGMASVVAPARPRRSARADLQFSNPSGTTLRVLDDGAGEPVDVNRGVGHRRR